jgi:hypothetical protein
LHTRRGGSERFLACPGHIFHLEFHQACLWLPSDSWSQVLAPQAPSPGFTFISSVVLGSPAWQLRCPLVGLQLCVVRSKADLSIPVLCLKTITCQLATHTLHLLLEEITHAVTPRPTLALALGRAVGSRKSPVWGQGMSGPPATPLREVLRVLPWSYGFTTPRSPNHCLRYLE